MEGSAEIPASLDLASTVANALQLVAKQGGLNNLAVFAKSMGPAFMILSFVVQLAFPSSSKMEKEFFKVNQKLVRIVHELNNLQNEIKSWAVSNRYFPHIMDIHYQTEKILDFYTSDVNHRYQREEDFLRAYKGTKEDRSLYVIYEGLPLILDTVLTTTNYNRHQLSIVSSILKDLLLMGVSCAYTFEYIRRGPNRGNAVLQEWNDKLIAAQKAMNDANSKCIQMAPAAAKMDIINFLNRMDANRSNQVVANEVYAHLGATYDWLGWAVIVMDSDSTNSHTLAYCCSPIDVKLDGGSNRIMAWHFLKTATLPSDKKAVFTSTFNSRRRPKLIAKRIFDYFQSNGIRGKVFVSRAKVNAAAAFGSQCGVTVKNGLIFAAYFP